MSQTTRLAKLGELGRTHEPDGAAAVREARALFEEAVATRQTPSRRETPRTMAWGLVAAAALAATVAMALRAGRGPSPLTFTVGPQRDRGEVGSWIAATRTEMPLHFSDGTLFVLAPAAHARVAAVRDDGANVVLEAGHVTVAVVHQPTTQWSVTVGPFDVRVTGTRFDVGWDPASLTFRIHLDEGSVMVAGCNISPRAVRAGETFETQCGGNAHPEPEPPAEPPASKPEGEFAVEPQPERPPATPLHAPVHGRDTETNPPAEPAPPTPTFRTFWSQGDYDAAYAAALPELDELTEREDADGLLVLAQVARLTRHTVQAENLWRACRRRFPNGRGASLAAFHLGRTATEPAEAARWFATALHEGAGPLEREALGRLLESQVAAGHAEAAKGTADRYLSAFPEGPHTALARATKAGP